MAARCRELVAERYEVVTAPGQATLVAFRPGEEDPADVVERCAARDVMVRSVTGAVPLIRASCGYWTSDDDLARLLSALEAR